MTETTFDVLVVDDEPVLCRAIRKIVTRDGFSIDDADSASGGLTKLKTNRYQAVLCDLMLAGIGGLGLLRSARRVLDDLPVVMITGYATLGSAIDSFRCGAFDFLPKPFDDDELMAVVRRALAFHLLDPADRRVVPYRELIANADGDRPPPVSIHALGTHSWALIDGEGAATIGVGESFNGLGGTWRDIDVPPDGETTQQARACIRITTDDGLVHRVWAPLSGTVVDRNPITPPAADGSSGHWLVRIVPSELENELLNLIPCWLRAATVVGEDT